MRKKVAKLANTLLAKTNKKVSADEVLAVKTRLDLIKILNDYGCRYERSQKISWLQSFIKDNIPELLESFKNNLYTTIHSIECLGVNCKLSMLGLENAEIGFTKENIINKIKEYIKPIKRKIVETSSQAIETEKPDSLVDEYYNKVDEIFNERKNVQPLSMKGGNVNTVKELAKDEIDYYEQEVKTERTYTKTEKTYLKWLSDIVNWKRTVTRKPRVIPPEKQVAKLRYAQSFEPLSLKSIKPTDILKALELIVYDTKHRKLYLFVAENQVEGLSVDRISITGYSNEKSIAITLRKPDRTLMNYNHTLLKKVLQDETTIKNTVKNRSNTDWVLLSVRK